jgi:hypothetical protein
MDDINIFHFRFWFRRNLKIQFYFTEINLSCKGSQKKFLLWSFLNLLLFVVILLISHIQLRPCSRESFSILFNFLFCDVIFLDQFLVILFKRIICWLTWIIFFLLIQPTHFLQLMHLNVIWLASLSILGLLLRLDIFFIRSLLCCNVFQKINLTGRALFRTKYFMSKHGVPFKSFWFINF